MAKRIVLFCQALLGAGWVVWCPFAPRRSWEVLRGMGLLYPQPMVNNGATPSSSTPPQATVEIRVSLPPGLWLEFEGIAHCRRTEDLLPGMRHPYGHDGDSAPED